MGITKDRGYWYFVKRVPKRFAHVDPRQKVTRALWTNSERDARIKAAAVEAEFMAYWEALAAGRSDDAVASYDAAVKLAHAHSFLYRPASDLPSGPLESILKRIESLVRSDGSFAPPLVAAAVLGGVDEPKVTITEALTDFIKFSAIERQTGKSERRIKRWRLPRVRAVATFVKLNGDLPMSEISREHAQRLRGHWAERISREG